MPAVFFGHGSPMNALERNDDTQTWFEFGRSIPKPRAILMVSAHWYVNATAVTAMESPRTIHDFYGFPDELSTFPYPAPGSTWLADRIVETLSPTWVGRDLDSWGLDHGTWSVLTHVFPDADVPVVQLSVNGNEPLDYHLDLGRRLVPLLDEGVLIAGSGNVVHNLRAISWGANGRGFDWADRFDLLVRDIMLDRPAQLADSERSADYSMAVPTPDHFLPLAYIAGIAAETGRTVRTFNEGRTMGSLSMTGYSVGA